jgi:uncharacterized membrane protein
MVAPYAVGRLWSRWRRREFDDQRGAALGLSLLFTFTGTGHFILTEPMTQMLPPGVPERAFLIYMTGVLEVA